MLVKCYLEILRELTAEFDLKLSMVLVLSERNKADVLTRMKRALLAELEDLKQSRAVVCLLNCCVSWKDII